MTLFDAVEDANFYDLVDIYGAGNWDYFFEDVTKRGLESELSNLLETYRIRVVMTAHPTQFYPRPVLNIIDDLRHAVSKDRIATVNEILMQLGKTPFLSKTKPTPIDEARSLIVFLEEVFYVAIPKMYKKIEKMLESLNQPKITPQDWVQIGFWPGGDRDGNPYVNASTTIRVALELRQSVLNCYKKDISKLLRRYTFVDLYPKIKKILKKLAFAEKESFDFVNGLSQSSLLVEENNGNKDRNENKESNNKERKEFYWDLDALYENEQVKGYKTSNEFLSDLLEIRQIIMEVHEGLFLDEIERVISCVKSFGFYFASMDIRESSDQIGLFMRRILDKNPISSKNIDIQSKAVKSVINGDTYKKMADDEKLAVLEEWIDREISGHQKHPKSHRADGNAEKEKKKKETDERLVDAISNIENIRHVQKINGHRSLHRYILSHTSEASHIVELFCLFLKAGYDIENIPVDFVPLFESVKDLKNADSVMKKLYDLPWYFEHIKRRKNKQIIMVGFSDGTKDGGYFACNWMIYKAKEAISVLSRRYGVDAVFFDGRGGPPARGGGNTRRFYTSLSRHLKNREVQLTIQGQTISSNFSEQKKALYNLEQLFTSGLESRLNFYSGEIDDREREVFDTMQKVSEKKYRELLKRKDFFQYLQTVSPLKYFGLSNVGSRPTSRGKKKGDSSDKKSVNGLKKLRAIPFVSSWVMLRQLVPAFYGLGTALEYVEKNVPGFSLRAFYRRTPFFQAIIGNSMQSLIKTDFRMTNACLIDERFRDIWLDIKAEAELTEKYIKQMTHEKLLGDETVNRLSIKAREAIIRPLVVIQQYALTQVDKINRKDVDKADVKLIKAQKEKWEKLIVRSFTGIINAGRNSV